MKDLEKNEIDMITHIEACNIRINNNNIGTISLLLKLFMPEDDFNISSANSTGITIKNKSRIKIFFNSPLFKINIRSIYCAPIISVEDSTNKYCAPIISVEDSTNKYWAPIISVEDSTNKLEIIIRFDDDYNIKNFIFYAMKKNIIEKKTIL